MLRTVQLSNLIDYNISLFHITICLKHPDGFPFLLFREDLLAYLSLILFNQTVGSTDNSLRRPIVLFQLEYFRIGIHFCKIQYIVNICSPERIDTLRIIPYHTHMLMIFCQLQHNAVLGIVGILIFIYQNVAKLLLITCQYFGMISEKNKSIKEQIIKIHGIRLPATIPITMVNIPDRRHLGSTITFISLLIRGISRRRNQVVLRIRDTCLHTTRFIDFLIQPHFFYDRAYQTFTVCRIIDGKL